MHITFQKGKNLYNNTKAPAKSFDSPISPPVTRSRNQPRPGMGATSKLVEMATKRARESDVGAAIQRMEEAQVKRCFLIFRTYRLKISIAQPALW